jgi:F-type H+-transporting ATPase subunit b
MKKTLLVLALPMLLLASEGGDVMATFPARALNFIIFAALLWYILFKKVRIQDFMAARANAIAEKLNSIQEKLKESKEAKKAAMAKVEEAKVTAKAFLETSKKEGKLLLSKLSADTDLEIENREKSVKDQMDIERRKMVRSVVSEVLDDLFSPESLKIDRDKFINIIMKKVA